MKKLLIGLVIIIIIIIGITVLDTAPQQKEKLAVKSSTFTEPIELCFYKETKTANNLYDVAWLRMNLAGEQVSGEFSNIPAEKDKKVGTFAGTVNPVDKATMTRTADVWWDALAEGTEVTEELKIVFGEGTAQTGFGEMIDRGDGVYVYKNSDAENYWQEMTDVACSDLDERGLVEKYVREHVKDLAPEDAVLGGSWYVLGVHVDPALKTGTVTYEDGHIQGSASFSYKVEDGGVVVGQAAKKAS